MKLQRKAIVDNFFRAGIDRLVNNKWITAGKWARNIDGDITLAGAAPPLAGAALPLTGSIKINGNEYIVPYSLIWYSCFMNLMGKKLPRAFITTIL